MKDLFFKLLTLIVFPLLGVVVTIKIWTMVMKLTFKDITDFFQINFGR